jgi:hypothetical protein
LAPTVFFISLHSPENSTQQRVRLYSPSSTLQRRLPQNLKVLKSCLYSALLFYVLQPVSRTVSLLMGDDMP